MHACGSITLLSTLLSLSTVVSSVTLDCSKIVAESVKWDISKLAGPRQVHELVRQGSQKNVIRNTTYTIDLCKPLKKVDEDSCPLDTRSESALHSAKIRPHDFRRGTSRCH